MASPLNSLVSGRSYHPRLWLLLILPNAIHGLVSRNVYAGGKYDYWAVILYLHEVAFELVVLCSPFSHQ